MEKLLFKPSEVGEAMGIGRSKIYEMLSRGLLPVVRIGGCIRIPAKDLRVWLEKQTAGTTGPVD
ncbi:MAG: helix-turn-helix domain-containing protein [Bryobacteraceae bacterium]